MAPFAAQDTRFTVFEQTTQPYTATEASVSSPITTCESLLNGSTFDLSNYVTFSELDSWNTSTISSDTRSLEIDLNLEDDILRRDSVQDKDNPLANPNPEVGTSVQTGVLFKARFYGQSHWRNLATQVSVTITRTN